ncbi:hypothetical protein [Methylobacterium sp. J-068]|uniref:hypothetical protein n=1 Tax=Methylobacterium sp. J-068 TaxID=2836649 RepID=UPI001FB8956E|nr:hypothetical protein [Methylobacterium sp. J-068]MCJ2036088.1 hypothetical protein [Methylobacterium sp. J-068]
MSLSGRQSAERAKLPYDLAALRVEVGLLRVEHRLSRAYDPDQPRTPAGQTGAGQWTSGDDGQDVVADDGSRVLSLRIRSQPSETWDEQHTVIAPDGTRTLFEMEGRTQTVRDGETGEILSRGTLTASGVQSEAFVQTVRSPMRGPSRGAAAVDAALALLGVLSQRSGSAIFVAPASEYKRGGASSSEAIWVGEVERPDLDLACPRHGEVQSLLDRTMASVTSSGIYLTPQAVGTRVHALMAEDVNAREDPTFVAEISYGRSTIGTAYHGQIDSIRLDILENTEPSTVCIYDPKTGKTGMKPRTAIDYAAAAMRNFPHAKRFILLEVRPSR